MPGTAAFLNAGADLGAALTAARRADALGYDSIWVTHGALHYLPTVEAAIAA
jgi:hypothetical protein